MDNASLTRLDTEFGARGKMHPAFWLFCAFAFDTWALLAFELRDDCGVTVELDWRRRARAANVSNKPGKFRTII